MERVAVVILIASMFGVLSPRIGFVALAFYTTIALATGGLS